jgi:hypothetical protein
MKTFEQIRDMVHGDKGDHATRICIIKAVIELIGNREAILAEPYFPKQHLSKSDNTTNAAILAGWLKSRLVSGSRGGVIQYNRGITLSDAEILNIMREADTNLEQVRNILRHAHCVHIAELERIRAVRKLIEEAS